MLWSAEPIATWARGGAINRGRRAVSSLSSDRAFLTGSRASRFRVHVSGVSCCVTDEPSGVKPARNVTSHILSQTSEPSQPACNSGRPGGSGRAMQTLRVDGVEELARALRAA